MDERHYVGVYWGDRKVTKEACVPPILDMLHTLRAHDPVFARWYLKLSTREESLAAEISDATARETLEQGIVPAADDVPDLPLAAQRLDIPSTSAERRQVVSQRRTLFVHRLPGVHDHLRVP